VSRYLFKKSSASSLRGFILCGIADAKKQANKLCQYGPARCTIAYVATPPNPNCTS
jgi:hypothetical protein